MYMNVIITKKSNYYHSPLNYVPVERVDVALGVENV